MAAFALNTAAFANGGGYSFGVRFTGSLAPFQATGVDQVRIVEEKLDIVLRRTEAAVEVRYLMKNFAEQPVSVRFGFPVEANFAEYDHSPEDRQQRASKLNES
ncbi:MAG: hypothetical protein HY901_33835, partial [Deltaproteobacteria bacterium]|nr:hypothetical protein [Deltaproteobacteria bacterium]